MIFGGGVEAQFFLFFSLEKFLQFQEKDFQKYFYIYFSAPPMLHSHNSDDTTRQTVLPWHKVQPWLRPREMSSRYSMSIPRVKPCMLMLVKDFQWN